MRPEVHQKDIAKRIGLSPSAVNLWETGKTEPSASDLVQLARWYHVSCDWLLGLDGGVIVNFPDSARKKTPPVMTVPVVLASEIAAWQWDSVTDILQAAIAYPPNTAAAMIVSGDAMLQTCQPGCYAVVSKDHPVEPGCVVLVSINSQPVMLRRLVRESGSDLLVPDDSRYPTFRVDENTRIIGRVTETTIRKVFI